MMSTLYPVNELFETIQGEAHHAGTPSVFVRLQGCPVGCAWCDTKHTWFLNDQDKVSYAAIAMKDAKPSPAWALMSTLDLLNRVRTFDAKHVVLTGGEPCLYDVYELCEALLATGRSVQIETSGCFPVFAPNGAWVTVSPKLRKPGGKDLHKPAIKRANEIKLPVAVLRDFEEFAKWEVLNDTRDTPVERWVQPVWQSKTSVGLCVELARIHGWKVSLQTHKYVGMR